MNQNKSALFILVSCDGDYVEMIKNILGCKKNIKFSVLATPQTKKKNYLSSRFKELRKFENFNFIDISLIKDYIKKENSPK
jgi:hypothetical protein